MDNLLALLGIQISTAAAALARSGRWSRLVRTLVLLSTLLTQIIIGTLVTMTSIQFTRPQWAGLLSGLSILLAFRFVDMAWCSGHHRSGNKYNVGNFTQDFWAKCGALFDFRCIGTPQEAKNTPLFSTYDREYTPSRGRFLLFSGLRLLLYTAVIDILTSQPPPPSASMIFAPARAALIFRPSEMTVEEIVTRFMVPIVAYIITYCLLNTIGRALAFISVSLCVSKPRVWPPLFGSLTQAYSIRQFWGVFWHQNLRITLTDCADLFVHTLLRFPRKSQNPYMQIFQRYAKITLVFAMSGLVHAGADVAGGVPWSDSRTLDFFLTQAVGIVVEDAFQALLPSQIRYLLPLWIRFVLGYIWVVLFMAWTVPLWIYPAAYHTATSNVIAPQGVLPFSYIKALRLEL